jgi:hypothetical protein
MRIPTRDGGFRTIESLRDACDLLFLLAPKGNASYLIEPRPNDAHLLFLFTGELDLQNAATVLAPPERPADIEALLGETFAPFAKRGTDCPNIFVCCRLRWVSVQMALPRDLADEMRECLKRRSNRTQPALAYCYR